MGSLRTNDATLSELTMSWLMLLVLEERNYFSGRDYSLGCSLTSLSSPSPLGCESWETWSPVCRCWDHMFDPAIYTGVLTSAISSYSNWACWSFWYDSSCLESSGSSESSSLLSASSSDASSSSESSLLVSSWSSSASLIASFRHYCALLLNRRPIPAGSRLCMCKVL